MNNISKRLRLYGDFLSPEISDKFGQLLGVQAQKRNAERSEKIAQKRRTVQEFAKPRAPEEYTAI